jgi:beta-galactosidase
LWEPGTLEAIGRNGGTVAARHELQTAGKASKILLTADTETITPTWDDIAFVTATITDQNGIPIPDASDTISFNVTGPGRIAALDNGDNLSHASFQASARRAFQGRCYAIIRASADSGRITVTASAPDLTAGLATIIVEPAHHQ